MANKIVHNMKLNNEPFRLIKEGSKTIELRLFDEKRSLLNKNDIIKFQNNSTNETLNVKIVNLYKYRNFDELYKYFDKVSMGYSQSDISVPKDMERYYSNEQQNKYGVLAIEIEKIN